MPDIQLGAHTIRSHGLKVARVHMHDWVILLLLVVLYAVLGVIEPFHRFVGEGMMEDLRYPLKSNTVPFWAVPVIAVMLPLCVVAVYYFIRRDVYDFHQATLGILYSVFVTAVITNAIKDAVGRPRPDFFWRCFPDGKGVYEPVTGNVSCTGIESIIKEGYKSFPSGHTSGKRQEYIYTQLSLFLTCVQIYCTFLVGTLGCTLTTAHESTRTFAGLGFLAWYISGKIRAFDRKGHVAKLCIVFLPLLLAALVGVSRVDDYWHHWQDVFAGGLLGLTVASFCYLQFFPPPYDLEGWGPHSYFEMLAESRTMGQPSTGQADSHGLQTSEMEGGCIQSHHDLEAPSFSERTGDTCRILSLNGAERGGRQ